MAKGNNSNTSTKGGSTKTSTQKAAAATRIRLDKVTGGGKR